MRRILLLIVALAIAAFAGWYYWNLSQRISSAPVSALLPRETIFLAHMPDFNRSLDEWHHCDIYQLYREPSVQDFLRKPLANLPTPKAFGAQTLQEIEQLDPKHAFLALTSMDGNNPKFVGGFRFRGSQQEAEHQQMAVGTFGTNSGRETREAAIPTPRNRASYGDSVYPRDHV